MPGTGPPLGFSGREVNNITFLPLNQIELGLNTIPLTAELSLTSLRGHMPPKA